MPGADRPYVADLAPGQVVVMGFDPQTDRLYWLGIDPAPSHLVLAEVTVATRGELDQPCAHCGQSLWCLDCSGGW